MFIFESVKTKHKTDELCDITKSKKSISEITKYCGDSKKLTGTFEELLKNFNLTYINTFGNLCLLLIQKGLILKKMFRGQYIISYLANK